MPSSPGQLHPKPIGPTIGSAIIVILLILGGLYYWASKLSGEKAQAQAPYIPSATTSIIVTH